MTPRQAHEVIDAWADDRGRRVVVHGVRDLTPGLSAAVVLRVDVEVDGSPRRLVLKKPAGGGQSLLARRDAASLAREPAFFQSRLASEVGTVVRLPHVDVIEHDGDTWLVQEDLSSALGTPWRTAELACAVEALGGLATIEVDPSSDPWLESEGWAAHLVGAASSTEQLPELDAFPEWREAFTSGERDALRTILQRAPEWAERLRALPTVLVHGDAHPGNAGWDEGRLSLVDWEHAGVGPPGFDAATFLSGFRLFGGVGEPREDQVLAAYLSGLPDSRLSDAAVRGFWLSLTTWALQIRLGPGATAIRDGLLGRGSEQERAALADVIEGSRRALRAQAQLDA